MLRTTFQDRRRIEQMSRDELARHQLARLNELLAEIVPKNRFYAEKLAQVGLPLASLADLRQAALHVQGRAARAPAASEFAANLTYPLDRYVRFHQTSGTRGRPLVVLDTADDWQWWIDCWQFVLDAAEVTADDRALLAFSFGPFIGFWSAARRARRPRRAGDSRRRHEHARPARADPHARGPPSSSARPATPCTWPRSAAENQIDVAGLGVRRIIVAGEPGGSVPAVRERIEDALGRRGHRSRRRHRSRPLGLRRSPSRGPATSTRPSSSPSSSLCETGQPGRRRRAGRTHSHDARPRGSPSFAIARATSCARVARRAAESASCCSKAASSAGPTTC